MTLKVKCLCGAQNDNADPKRFEAHMKEAHGRSVTTWAHQMGLWGDEKSALVRRGKLVKKADPGLQLPEGADNHGMVTWTDIDGNERTGQVWARAHLDGSWWVIPTDRRIGDPTIGHVHFGRIGRRKISA